MGAQQIVILHKAHALDGVSGALIPVTIQDDGKNNVDIQNADPNDPNNPPRVRLTLSDGEISDLKARMAGQNVDWFAVVATTPKGKTTLIPFTTDGNLAPVTESNMQQIQDTYAQARGNPTLPPSPPSPDGATAARLQGPFCDDATQKIADTHTGDLKWDMATLLCETPDFVPSFSDRVHNRVKHYPDAIKNYPTQDQIKQWKQQKKASITLPLTHEADAKKVRQFFAKSEKNGGTHLREWNKYADVVLAAAKRVGPPTPPPPPPAPLSSPPPPQGPTLSPEQIGFVADEMRTRFVTEARIKGDQDAAESWAKATDDSMRDMAIDVIAAYIGLCNVTEAGGF